MILSVQKGGDLVDKDFIKQMAQLPLMQQEAVSRLIKNVFVELSSTSEDINLAWMAVCELAMKNNIVVPEVRYDAKKCAYIKACVAYRLRCATRGKSSL